MDSEPLPFIDEHARGIAASPERVWTALLATVGNESALTLPPVIIKLWGLQQTERTGNWADAVAPGDGVLGFRVAQCQPQRLLSLRGNHRFSHYELRFELDSSASGQVALHAKTFAVFPGMLGRLYRALVIGTGSHTVVVRRLLSSVARRSMRNGELRSGTSTSP